MASLLWVAKVGVEGYGFPSAMQNIRAKFFQVVPRKGHQGHVCLDRRKCGSQMSPQPARGSCQQNRLTSLNLHTDEPMVRRVSMGRVILKMPSDTYEYSMANILVVTICCMTDG